jgi:ribonuclease HI
MPENKKEQTNATPDENDSQEPMLKLPEGAINEAIAVDAACSGNPGKMEYRGVYLRTGKTIFHFGPVFGTNNIGEFLAIVHGLALLKQKNLPNLPIYSDSVNAQLWVRKKKCKTTLERNEKTEQLFQMIERAEKWLITNSYTNPIIKWPTDKWGEIPADFGRK